MNYLLRTQNSRKEIIARSGGSTRYNVGQSILSEIEVILTGLPEQQKIASFLSSVDERLRLLQQKKEKLERYKKGVIQKLFPKAGEKTPEIRFKDDNGKDFPEWEEKTLGRMGEFFGGGTPDKSKQEFWEGNIPWVSSSDIEEGSIRNIKITRFITDEAIKNSATKRIPKGSILIVSRVGIGKFALAETELCTSQDFTSFYPQELHAEFLTYYFVSQPQRLQRFAQGTSIKGFTSKNLRDLKLYIPMSKKEQQKIASFLSSIDRSIEKLETEITGTEKFKKGLLQKMFV